MVWGILKAYEGIDWSCENIVRDERIHVMASKATKDDSASNKENLFEFLEASK